PSTPETQLVIELGELAQYRLIPGLQTIGSEQAVEACLDTLVLLQHLSLLSAAVRQAQGKQARSRLIAFTQARLREQTLQLRHTQVTIANSPIRQGDYQPISHVVVVIRPVSRPCGL